MDFNPYAAPASSSGPPDEPAHAFAAGEAGRRNLPPFASAHFRMMIVSGLLVVFILCSAALGFSRLSEAAMIDDAMHGRAISAEEAGASDSRVQTLAIVKLVVYLAWAVMFLAWLYRTHGNLRALGAERLEFSPGGVIGWWFVPIANFVKPYLIVRETWLASNPEFVGDKA